MIAPCEECISLAICKSRGELFCEDLWNFVHKQKNESEIEETWLWLKKEFLRGRRVEILIQPPNSDLHIIYRVS